MRAPEALRAFSAALLFALLLAAAPRPGRPAAVGAPLPPADRDAAFRTLRDRQKEVRSVRAFMVQRKSHPLLASETVTEGTLLFRKPNLLRFDLDKPEKTVIVLDGETMTIWHPARREAERRDLQGDFASRAAAEFMTTGMSLSLAELEKRFRVEVAREGRTLVLRLSPRSKWLARAIASIAIYQGDEDPLPGRIVIQGAKGDRTETVLSRVTLNPALPDDLFALRFGPEVRVTETGAPGKPRDDAP